MDFWAKNDHCSNFDKMAGNDRIRLLYSSKQQKLANCPRNKCQKLILYAEDGKLAKKKLRGTKMSIKYFCHFWFCAICGSTKSCLIFKIIPQKTISKILSFESISVFISQKLRKLDQKNILRFFSPLCTCKLFPRKVMEDVSLPKTDGSGGSLFLTFFFS